jgi:hypothetical protein
LQAIRADHGRCPERGSCASNCNRAVGKHIGRRCRRHVACTLSRRGTCTHRAAWRAGSSLFQCRNIVDPVHQGRQTAPACGDRIDARGSIAGFRP